jgi:Trk K+ transport system NAD-binding subunit
MVTGVSMVVFVYGLFTDFLVRMRVEEAFGQKRSALSNHVIVAGGGELGARVATQLHGLGVPVIVVERDPGSAATQSLTEDIPVLAGDATFEATLDRAGVASARAVVAVTDDDMTNLRIAQETEEVNLSARTVVRLFRSRLASKMGESLLGMDVPLNPSEAAAATFVACALEPDVLHGFTLDGKLLLLKKVQARERGITVPSIYSEIEDARGSIILHQSGADGAYRSPDAGSEVAPDDWLIVLEEHRQQDVLRDA